MYYLSLRIGEPDTYSKRILNVNEPLGSIHRNSEILWFIALNMEVQ